MRNLTLFALNLLISITCISQTEILGGEISGTWTKANSPYNINGNITVTSGTLIIEPGVEVIFQDLYSISVKNWGSIQARGNSDDTIKFTVNDTTGFYLNNHLGWKGIRYYNMEDSADSSIFKHCSFEYSKKTISGSEIEKYGGAFYISSFDKLHFELCDFENNSSYRGGAFYIMGSDPFIVDCNMINNICYGTPYTDRVNGGAMYLEYSSASIINCNIINNTCYALNYYSYGGGLYLNESDANIINCNIFNNSCYCLSHNSYGGGLFLSQSDANIINCNIIKNNALSDETLSSTKGGGIYAGASNPYVYNCIFWNNISDDEKQVFLSSGEPDFKNCCVENGSPFEVEYYENCISSNPNFLDLVNNDFALTDSSTIINMGDTIGISYLIPNYDFVGNPRMHQGLIDIGSNEFQNDIIAELTGYVSSEEGNPIVNYEIYPGIFTNSFGYFSIASGNDGINYGEEIEFTAPIGYEFYPGGVIIKNNQNLDLTAYKGIVIDDFTDLSETNNWDSDTVNVFANVELENKNLIIQAGVKVKFYNSSGIIVSGSGSIIALGTEADSILFTVADTTGFVANTHVGWAGVEIKTMASIADSSIFEYCIFEYGKKVGLSYIDYYGGVISVSDFEKFRISNSIIAKNCLLSTTSSSVYGGGISFKNSKAIISNCQIIDNISKINYVVSSFKSYGGGLSIIMSNVLINNTQISGNECSTRFDGGKGGGLYIGNSNVELSHCTISNNFSDYGGGLYLYSDDSKIINCNITGNTGGEGVYTASGIHFNYSNTKMINSNFLNNNSSRVVYFPDSEPKFYNCIFWGNEDSESVSGMHSGNGEPYFYNCCIEGPILTNEEMFNNCINSNPDFVNEENRNYRLQETSPCINFGDTSNIWHHLPDLDMYGNPRIHQNYVDIGSSEFQMDISIMVTGSAKYENGMPISNFVIYPGIETDINGNFSISTGENGIDYGDTIIFNDPPNFEFYSNFQVLIQNKSIEIIAYNGIVIDEYSVLRDANLWETDTVNVFRDIELINSVLLIDEGVVVRFHTSSGIQLSDSSKIIALGSLTDSIRFTVADTSGFFSQNHLGWKGVLFENMNSNADSSLFEYCVLEYVKNIGSDYSEYPGAIGVYEHDKLKMSNCKISDNISKIGGGVHLFNSDVKIEMCDISNNNASESGGGINCISSEAKIHKCKIHKNFSPSAGGIYMLDSKILLTNSEIYKNESHYGGGIYTKNSNDALLINCNIVGNSAYHGGGFYIKSTGCVVTNSNIWGNTATTGEQIYGIDVSGQDFLNCNIENIIPYNSFNYINCIEKDPLFVNLNTDDFSLQNNSPSINSGDTLFLSHFPYDDDIIGNPRIHQGLIDIGPFEFQEDIQRTVSGYARYENGDPLINKTIFPSLTTDSLGFYSITSGSNGVNYGDTIFLESEDTYEFYPRFLSLNQNEIKNVIQYKGIVIDEFSQFSDSTSWTADTINVFVDINLDSKKLSINSDTKIKFHNYTSISLTGSSSIVAKGTKSEPIMFTVSDTSGYHNNSHLGWKGLNIYINMQSDSSIFKYCVFEYSKKIINEYSNGYAGAIKIYGAYKMSFENCDISKNYLATNNLASYGGGIYISYSKVTLINCNINNNKIYSKSNAYGGGIYTYAATVDFINCNIFKNVAEARNSYNRAYSGGLGESSSKLNIINCNITENKLKGSKTYGGGLSLYQSNDSICNTLIWGNDARYDDQVNLSSGSPLISNCCIQDGNTFGATEYVNCISENPQFVNINKGNYTLKESSPCIDAGSNAYNNTLTDLRSYNRIIGDSIDIGVYEYGGYSISGTVTGTSNVNITMNGSSSFVQNINNNGVYLFDVEEGFDISITANKQGYTFEPASYTFVNLDSNATNQNFSASIQTYTVEGLLSGANGVDFIISGDIADNQIVNSGDSYSLDLELNQSIVITPYKDGFTFVPQNYIVDNIVDNINDLDFIATINSYLLEGAVNGAEEVLIEMTGDVTGSQTINSGETYNFVVEYGQNVIITASKNGYSFEPENYVIDNVQSNILDHDFDATINTYTIEGTVTGAEEVLIEMIGGATGSQTINSDGIYSFEVEHGQNVVITASKNGYSFAPENYALENVQSNILDHDFDATINTYTIEGTVTGAEEVLIEMTGDVTATQTINSGEIYNFVVDYGQNVIITASKNGYNFEPENYTLDNVQSNILDHDFDATLNSYTIEGTVTGAEEVLIEMTGDVAATQTVNSGEIYNFVVEHDQNVVITASKNGYSFAPENYVLDNVESNVTDQNFDAIINTYTIEGTVSGTEEVLIEMTGDVAATQTVNSGEIYNFVVEHGQNVLITASKNGYSFEPENYALENVQSNILDHDFDATINSYTIEGTVTGAEEVLIEMTGDVTASQTVNSGEIYIFMVEHGQNVIITASKNGYSFDPENYPLDNVENNILDRDFDATINTYTIEGTVTGAEEVLIEMTGDVTATQTINSGEIYSFVVEHGQNVLITASKNGYSFDPENYALDNVENNISDHDFDAIINTYTIEGTVTGVDEVLIEMTGDVTASQTINSGEIYSFVVEHGQNVLITASKNGYSFDPENYALDNVENNISDRDFDATLNSYTIEGTVTGVDEVLIEMTGDVTASQTINSGEIYSFVVEHGQNVLITASKNGYSFEPENYALDNVENNTSDRDFDATLNSYTIEGTVTGAEEVLIEMTGDVTASQTINSGEIYSFVVEHGQNVLITASKNGYSFEPENYALNNVENNISDRDFDATINTYSIQGIVSGVDAVLIQMTGDITASQTLNSGEIYSFMVEYNQSVVIVANKEGFTFNPQSYTFNNVQQDLHDNDFSSTVGIDDFTFNHAVIYPNPVSNKLNMEIPEELNIDCIEISSIRGELIYKIENIESNKYEINLSKYQSGIYLVNLISNKGVSFIQKLVKL